MAITVFLAGVKSSVASFVADATVEVSQTFSNQIASHPVDDRSNVSDHVWNQNPSFTIRGVVSNYPVTEYASNIIGYDGDRVNRADKLLQEWWKNRSEVTILTEYNDFNYCVLESYSAPFTAQTSEVLEFEIRVQQIRKASSSVVTVILPESLQIDSEKDKNGAGQAAVVGSNLSSSQSAAEIRAELASGATSDEVNWFPGYKK